MGEVAEAYGIDRSTLYRWAVRKDTVGLLRKEGSGRPRLLQELTEEQLVKVVLKPATSYGYETDLWTIGRVHQLIQKEYQTQIFTRHDLETIARCGPHIPEAGETVLSGGRSCP